MMRRRFGKTSGFTLVELVVVIAILGILAGIGTAGYAGYVKNAKKNSDKVLVGNIIRAIETGTNSTMYENEDSVFIGSTTYPVGFIVLSNNTGARVMTSTTERTTVDDPCEFVEVKNVTLIDRYAKSVYCKYNVGSFGCTETGTVTLYNIRNNCASVFYCTTHSSQNMTPTTLSSSAKYNTSLGVLVGAHDRSSHEGWSYKTTTVNAGTYVLDGHTYDIYEKKNDNICEYVYAYKYETFDEDNSVGTTIDHPLYDSIAAAFGNLSDLRLSYDGWGNAANGETHTYATFYSSAPTLMEDVSSLATTLIINKRIASDYLSGDYNTAQDMVEAFAAAATSGEMTQEKWLEYWDAAKGWSEPNYAFGMSGKDFIYAARKAYNTSFAAYCQTNGVSGTYANVIKNYKHTAMGVLPIPDAIGNAAFSTKSDVFTYSDNSTTESLYAQFKATGEADYDAAFDKCKSLYETYQNSDACTQNGIAVYKTMKTINETKDVAKDVNNVEGGDFFKYYDRYLEEYDNILKEADAMAGDGIVIMVMVENGVVKCDVSPSAANPRNEK